MTVHDIFESMLTNLFVLNCIYCTIQYYASTQINSAAARYPGVIHWLSVPFVPNPPVR